MYVDLNRVDTKLNDHVYICARACVCEYVYVLYGHMFHA